MIKNVFLLIICCLYLSSTGMAQSGAPYSNSWINYDQKYVKITVTESGLHKVPLSILPSDFTITNKANLQLIHRGKEVSIISVDEKEIIFYGVSNDGSSDSLFYRPMSERLNSYLSLYSNQSAYFLTVGKVPGKRSATVPYQQYASDVLLQHHLQNNLTINKTEYSQSSEKHVAPDFLNSFFEKGATKTGVRLVGDTLLQFPFQLSDYVASSSFKPHVRLLLNGMSNNTRGIEVYAGKSAGTSRKVGTLSLQGFTGKIFEFDLADTDFLSTGAGVISLKSTSNLPVERFSIAFISIVFPQALKMGGLTTKMFEIPSSSEATSKVEINGLKDDMTIYDVTNVDEPKSILRDGPKFTLKRVNNQKISLLVSSSIRTTDKANIAAVTFNKINPTAFNYIIITNELLAEASKTYSAYRSSAEGGSYKAIVVKIKDVYNQFNYGEISPIAIRRFVDYMISDNNKDKHLFLIGKSVNPIEKMIPDLEECIPAVGYPGSDILLVEGLGGSPKDVPAIPVGRLMIISAIELQEYLVKVKHYEANTSGDLAWRKKILHLNGGHTAGEINQFRQVLSSLSPLAEEGALGGKVQAVVKQSSVEVESVNVAPEVNEGVGMFTYFGHGSRNKTDLDFGYVSDPERGFADNQKYPLMYFNGCGVGNIFRGLFNPVGIGSDRRPLSLDWILTPNKGAIAIIANSYYSYTSPSLKYLNKLYETLFKDAETAQLSIGNVQKVTISKIMNEPTSFFDIANIHQAVLQGDPALHLINVDKADFALDRNESIFFTSDTQGQLIGNAKVLKTGIVLSNAGKFEMGKQIPLTVTYTFENGTSETLNSSFNAIPYKDTIYISVPAKGSIQRVEVIIDEKNTIPELDKSNNKSELNVEWEVAKQQVVYPAALVKDIIAPNIFVNFNNRTIANDEILQPDPVINILVEDDRFLDPNVSILDVFYKACGDESCDFVRLAPSDINGLEAVNSHTAKFGLRSGIFTDGIYELMINSRDLAGNVSLIPYRIKFEIKNETPPKISVISSPNPASSYIKFKTSKYAKDQINSISSSVYDIRGILLQSSAIAVGNTEWYFYPMTSGLYIYRIIFVHRSGEIEEIKGKVVVTR